MGTRYNRLAEAVQTCTHEECFEWKCLKKIKHFPMFSIFAFEKKKKKKKKNNLCILHGRFCYIINNNRLAMEDSDQNRYKHG